MRFQESPPKGSSFYGTLHLTSAIVSKKSTNGAGENSDGEDDLLPAFLSRIGPRVAVISVGAGNSFGHPTAETLDALESSGAAVFRTDRDGDVTVESRDGRVVRVGTERRSSAE